MAEHEDKQIPLAVSGCFQDLVDCLNSLKSDSDSAQLEDRTFILSVEEFHYVLNLIPGIPCKIGKFSYDGKILYFKNMGTIHEGVTEELREQISNQLQQYAAHPVVGALVTNSLRSLGGRPVMTGRASYREPDFSFGEGKICTVICVDLYYARGPNREAKTAAELDRSAISEEGTVDLYLSDMVLEVDLPAEFVRPQDANVHATPQIRVPFTAIVNALRDSCHLVAEQTRQPPRRRHGPEHKSNKRGKKAAKELRDRDRKIQALERQIEEKAVKRRRDDRKRQRDDRKHQREERKRQREGQECLKTEQERLKREQERLRKDQERLREGQERLRADQERLRADQKRLKEQQERRREDKKRIAELD
ncbi:hypothetical protein SAPIO_CDS4703 [Scedosporium apiospermum]|uniref:Uncharacterized protein n=1 Tax=Pseudallescheria apiosperma TaxID=563466 RepID=A0A084G7F6_PSEDA|nr:uncharacterized protein SAPIO_CDS4703 [Scedosporium apiospermum]KEZ43268.1 hypothetical protein SAPIO_CDS4703 [Scedosporium apiospermum]